MKIFGFAVIRWNNLQKLHARNKELREDIASLNIVVERKEEDIDALKVKCSRVNISKLENRIIELEQGIKNEKMPGDELHGKDLPRTPMLPGSLVSATEGNPQQGVVFLEEPKD